MEIVINIPRGTYMATCDGCMLSPDVKYVIEAIKNGTLLPEHHGRIIDESKINEVYAYTEECINKNIKAIRTTITHTDAPTIIEGSDPE